MHSNVYAAKCVKMITQLRFLLRTCRCMLHCAEGVADDHLKAMFESVSQNLTATSASGETVPSTKSATGSWKASSQSRSLTLRKLVYVGGGVAAMLIVSSVIFFGGLSSEQGGQPLAMPTPTKPAVDDAYNSIRTNTIGHIVSLSDDCEWIIDRQDGPRAQAGDPSAVFSGAIVRVMEGELTLEFVSGVQVRLVGHTLYCAESGMRGRVLLGKCRATVSPGAEGFTLESPSAAVVDLGTEFGLEVGQRGEADVVVYDGAVEVDSDEADDLGEIRTSLVVGEAVRIASGGKLTRLTSVFSDKFLSPSKETPGNAKRPLILNVEDNLQLVWKFYEIVPRGMEEDVKAFVDLENQHEWNGLTRLGMPSYLVNGDYVKMFKGDQIRDDVEIRVKLGRPADLYILFDEVVPTPAWLESGFVRTGDRIGLDMGPWEGETGDQYENGKGPGNSVDRVAVVWRSREPVSGTVHLGATESGVLGTSMYGIVAQPAEN